MAVKEIVHDSMFLAQKSVPATDCAEDRQTITDLLDTLKAHLAGCVGMAANMIGVKKTIIVVSMGFMQVAMVNPKIVKQTKPYETEEGCLSLLGGPRKCKRFDEIEVEYLDANFIPKKGKFTGFTAQIIQHECDHCNGVLI